MPSLTRTKISDDILARVQMPPGIGISRQAHGHSENGDEEGGNEQAGDGKGKRGGAKSHINLCKDVNSMSLRHNSILARRRERTKYQEGG